MSGERTIVSDAESGPRQVTSLARLIGPQGAQLIRLFDCIDAVQVWIKDRHGRYLWVNRAFLMHYAVNNGVPCAELNQVLGRTDYDLCPAYLADQYRSDDERVLTGHCVVDRIELVGQHESLATWNVTNKIPLRAANGSVVGSAGLTRRLEQRDTAVAPGINFGPMLDYLRDHFHETTTNSQLARLAGLSVRAFERKFCATFQMPPQEYLRKLRLRMASQALVFTQQSIAEVALNCGFADQSHFTREFHRYSGRTPRDYREWYARPAATSVTKRANPGPEQTNA
jgi:AraC-like DNA-binding protein